MCSSSLQCPFLANGATPESSSAPLATHVCRGRMVKPVLLLSRFTGCLRPLASSNGYVNISEFQTSFPVGTVIAYRCFPGFKLEGSEYLECLHNLIWSSSPPRCLALEGNTYKSFGHGCFGGRCLVVASRDFHLPGSRPCT